MYKKIVARMSRSAVIHLGASVFSHALVLAFAAMANGAAQAQVNGCTVMVAPLSFGAYDVGATSALVTTSKVDIRCTSATTLTIGFDGGNPPSSAAAARQLRHVNGSDTMSYALYQDATLTAAWGNAVLGTGRTIAVTNTSSAFIYGVVPAGQDVRFGEYRDSLSVVVMP
jgi:spore coat protein U-like protein